MARHDTEYGNQQNTNKQQTTVPSGRVTTPNVAPSRRVTTPNAAPSARVTTPNTAPSRRVTTPNAAPSARVTTPNAAPSARVTTPNAASSKRATTPNAVPSGRKTTPDAAAAQMTSRVGTTTQVISISNLPAGTCITDEIVITERLNTAMQGGESIMYKCKLGDAKEDYVIKLFLRQIDDAEFEAKEHLIEVLNGVQFVAPVLRYGRYGGNYYEVIPYYKNGSLADRLKKGTMSESEIRKDILPKLNAALHAVHQAGVIHADIKPSNILYSNNRKSFVLIDFGISRITDERRFVTTAGKSADYAAPEVQLGKAAKESDYFSLGISLYELFAGKTPTADVDDKDVAFRLLLQNGGRIRKKQGMSDNFYALLLQLTYQFIVPEKSSQTFPINTRWSYAQVQKWLSMDCLPEDVLQRILQPTSEPVAKPSLVFAYNNSVCNSLNELIIAMSRSHVDTAYYYMMAPQDSFSAALEVGCRSNNAWTRETMLALKKKYRAFRDALSDRLPREDKLIMFYYTFSDNLDALFLPSMELIEPADFPAAGKQLLERMQEDREDSEDTYRPLLTRGILQSYLLQRNGDEMTPVERRLLEKLDELCEIARYDDSWEVAVYALGYILAGSEPYRVGKYNFSGIKNLTENLARQESNPRQLIEMIGLLVKNSNELDDRFAGWLISLDVPYHKIPC